MCGARQSTPYGRRVAAIIPPPPSHLSVTPRGPSSAHSARQKPSLMQTRERRSVTASLALAADQRSRRIRYMMASVAERLTPAPQCTSTAAWDGAKPRSSMILALTCWFSR